MNRIEEIKRFVNSDKISYGILRQFVKFMEKGHGSGCCSICGEGGGSSRRIHSEHTVKSYVSGVKTWAKAKGLEWIFNISEKKHKQWLSEPCLNGRIGKENILNPRIRCNNRRCEHTNLSHKRINHSRHDLALRHWNYFISTVVVDI